MPFNLQADSGFPLKTIDNGDGTHTLVISIGGNVLSSIAASGFAKITGDAVLAPSGGISFFEAGQSIFIYAPPALNWAQEAPTGAVDGVNVTYTLGHTPSNPAAFSIDIDGVRQRQGAGLEYTISGNTITLGSAPASAPTLQQLWAIYPY